MEQKRPLSHGAASGSLPCTPPPQCSSGGGAGEARTEAKGERSHFVKFAAGETASRLGRMQESKGVIKSRGRCSFQPALAQFALIGWGLLAAPAPQARPSTWGAPPPPLFPVALGSPGQQVCRQWRSEKGAGQHEAVGAGALVGRSPSPSPSESSAASWLGSLVPEPRIALKVWERGCLTQALRLLQTAAFCPPPQRACLSRQARGSPSGGPPSPLRRPGPRPRQQARALVQQAGVLPLGSGVREPQDEKQGRASHLQAPLRPPLSPGPPSLAPRGKEARTRGQPCPGRASEPRLFSGYTSAAWLPPDLLAATSRDSQPRLSARALLRSWELEAPAERARVGERSAARFPSLAERASERAPGRQPLPQQPRCARRGGRRGR